MKSKFALKSLIIVLVLNVIFSRAIAQRSYSSDYNPNETMKEVFNERFEYNNNGWPIGQNENGSSSLATHDRVFWLSCIKQISLVNLVPKWQYTSDSDFIVKVNFGFHKPLIKEPKGGNCGGGFAWGATAPFKSMQVLYFSYTQPEVKYIQWNEKGEYKVLAEKKLPEKFKNNFNHLVEIHRKGNTLFFYETIKDSLQLLLSAPYQPFQGNTNVGFYVDGEITLGARKLNISEQITQNDKAINEKNRAEDFVKWKAIAYAREKENSKYANKDDLKIKDKVKYNSIKQELAQAYFQMACIKRLDKDFETAVKYFTLAADIANPSSNYRFYFAKVYEDNFKISKQENDKTLALQNYFIAAKSERTDLGFPRALKAYYSLKYPFITDFSYINNNWQREDLVPKTKQEYDKLVANTNIAAAKLKQEQVQAQANLAETNKQIAQRINMLTFNGNYVISQKTLRIFKLQPGKPVYQGGLVSLETITTASNGQAFEKIDNLENKTLYKSIKGYKVCPYCQGKGAIKTEHTKEIDKTYSQGKIYTQTTTYTKGCQSCGGGGVIPN